MAFQFHLPRDEFADALGGAIPEGALIVLEGEYGTGKSIVTERLLYGFLSNGHRATVVSTEKTTMQFADQMHSLDYTVDEHLLEGSLLFVPVYPIMGFRMEGVDLLARLCRADRVYDSDIVIIDAFSAIVKSWMKGLPPGTNDRQISERLQDVIHFFKILNSQGKTLIVTLQPGDVPDDVASFLKAAADVYLMLQLDVRGNDVTRSLFVRRFERSAKAVRDVVAFRVEPKTGLIVEIKSVS